MHSRVPQRTSCEGFGISSVCHSDLSSLELNEFTFPDLDDLYLSAGKPWYDPLFKYLQKHFRVEDIWVILVLRGPERPVANEAIPLQRSFLSLSTEFNFAEFGGANGVDKQRPDRFKQDMSDVIEPIPDNWLAVQKLRPNGLIGT
ncbi:hypothetical protein ACJ72_00465 [Emergomyces africanus]|uniref:Uncharacterized protein n=1 Tax=Emergomyces africanus TaxID=1955775 RepID=A0A1B7P836_9EURO|nr:hypothetical protein ACJ72_00465 [Emergomyces africanus]